MLIVKALYDGCDILEPGSIGRIDYVLAPVSVASEELSYLIDILKAFGFVLSPDGRLLRDQIRKHVLQLVLKFS